MYEYLRSNGMTAEEYEYCRPTRLKPHCIMGNDYYWTNEHRVPVEGKHSAAGEVFGYYEITRQYYDRYRPAGDAHRDQLCREGARRRGG
jgi:hypothetical protein